MGRAKPRISVIAALGFGLVLAACGGQASAEVTGFCQSVLETEALISEGPGEDVAAWAEQVTQSLQSVEEQAPDEVAGAVETIRASISSAVETGDEEAFFAALESDEFGEAAAVVDTYMTDECGWEVTDVAAVDYAFEAELDGIQAGFNGFAFDNQGNEMHEMVLFRINDDVTESIDQLLQLPEEEAMSKATVTGSTFGAPGDSDTLFVDLDPGRYAIVCFLPVGATPENMEALESGEVDGPPHFTQGMVREFTVGG